MRIMLYGGRTLILIYSTGSKVEAGLSVRASWISSTSTLFPEKMNSNALSWFVKVGNVAMTKFLFFFNTECLKIRTESGE